MDDENKTNDVPANSAGFDVSAAFFGTATQEQKPESDENGGEPSLSSAEEPGINESGNGGEDAGDPEQSKAVEVWQFNDQEYTSEQVSDALKHRETFERFNQSINPLIENIKAFGQTAERMKIMGVTETEHQIAELQKALASGQLNAREYQEAHQALTRAEMRKTTLEQAANQEAEQRKQALNQARTHNARQVATNLIKSGWTKEQMNQAQALAQQFMTPDQFADSLTPGLMEVLRDAAELRGQKQKAADALKDKARKAIKVGGKPTQATPAKPKTSKAGDAEWMAKNFWGGK